MRSFADPGTWQSPLMTLLGLGMVTLLVLGVRLIVMQRLQRRRERENRQINERLRLLIAAYKTLGGSFTGDLAVDPTHLRHVRSRESADDGGPGDGLASDAPGSQRRRRVRDAVEAALSDVILLGTADQVELAVAAANDLVAGRKVETGALVVALRTYIRHALDLEPLPDLVMPKQGPTRTPSTGGRGGVTARAGTGGGRVGGGGAEGSGHGGLAVARSADDDK
jgi:hypothetical protein